MVMNHVKNFVAAGVTMIDLAAQLPGPLLLVLPFPQNFFPSSALEFPRVPREKPRVGEGRMSDLSVGNNMHSLKTRIVPYE